MKTKLISIAVISLLVTGCATTPPPIVAPAPLTQATAPLAVAPALVTGNIPSWFLNPPEATTDAVFVVGAAISRDISMSVHKAQLDAETHLANKIAGEINTMTKDYKRDVGDEFVQSTEIVANKIARDVKVIGGTVINKQITAEGGGFRTYILLRFPLGNNNQMLQSYINKKSFRGSKEAAERELNQRSQEQRDREDVVVEPVTVSAPKVISGGDIVIRETRATPESGPLGVADRQEEN